MRKTGAKMAWPCMNIIQSRDEKMSDSSPFLPPPLFFPFFFPTRPESCLALLSAKVVPSVCMLHKLCFS